MSHFTHGSGKGENLPTIELIGCCEVEWKENFTSVPQNQANQTMEAAR